MVCEVPKKFLSIEEISTSKLESSGEGIRAKDEEDGARVKIQKGLRGGGDTGNGEYFTA